MPAAWWRTRLQHPVVGVTLEVDDLVFEPIFAAEDARAWAERTAVAASNTAVESVQLERARSPLADTSMTLVADPSSGLPGLVLNMSHALVNHELYAIVKTFLKELVSAHDGWDLEDVFVTEDPECALHLLPRSLAYAYTQAQPRVTEAEQQSALKIIEQAGERWAKTSIGIPARHDWAQRPSRTHNKTIILESQESLAAFTAPKALGITLNTAFFACMTAAIAQRYGSKNVDGAHLLFSFNAMRMIAKAENKGGPVTMTILPAGAYLDANKANLAASTQKELVALAKCIGKTQMRDISTPHMIGIYDMIAPSMAQGIKAAIPPQSPVIGRPTLSSQGTFASVEYSEPETAGQNAASIRMTDFRTGGRNTDPNVCFALYSFDGELRCNLMFDERYFDQDEVMQVAYATLGLFRKLLQGDGLKSNL